MNTNLRFAHLSTDSMEIKKHDCIYNLFGKQLLKDCGWPDGRILDDFCWPSWNLLSPAVLRLKSKPKSMTFTGESTDGVKKSTFSGFKSRCKTPGHSGGGEQSRQTIWRIGSLKKRTPLHLIIMKNLASSPSSLQASFRFFLNCFIGSFCWKQHHKPQKLPLENMITTYLHHTLHKNSPPCVNLRTPPTNVILPRWWQ